MWDSWWYTGEKRGSWGVVGGEGEGGRVIS